MASADPMSNKVNREARGVRHESLRWQGIVQRGGSLPWPPLDHEF